MNNNFFIFTFLLFLLLGVNSTAQDTTVREFPMEERALLWKIEGNGIKTKSYIFGTVHLVDDERFFFPKKLEKIVSKSDVLTMEIAGLPDPKEVLELSLLPEGKFFDFFSEVEKDSILNWVESHSSMGTSTFEVMVTKMRPFVVAQLLPELDESNPSPGMEGKKSYEVEFESIAEYKKLEIKGLETVTDQMKIFDQFDSTQQVEMVMSVIRNKSTNEADELEKVMALYEAQDLDGLYQLIMDSGDEMDAVSDAILGDRNRRWIPLIEKMIAEKSTFIAVGAGHLGGPIGVIRLLEAQGYTLTPIEL